MKWIGWVVAPCLGFIAFLYVLVHAKDEKEYAKTLEERVDKEYVSALDVLKPVEQTLPQLEKKLGAEKVRAAALAKQAQAREAEKQGLATTNAALARDIEELSAKRESHAARRQQDSQEVKDLQAKITRLKLEVEQLQERVLTVTETSELPK